jgi:hypothetical protein
MDVWRIELRTGTIRSRLHADDTEFLGGSEWKRSVIRQNL